MEGVNNVLNIPMLMRLVKHVLSPNVVPLQTYYLNLENVSNS